MAIIATKRCTMVWRCFVILAALGLALAGCANGPRNKTAVDDLERRHDEQMIRMGGGGGSMRAAIIGVSENATIIDTPMANAIVMPKL